ncbi:MAG: hypothetical protein ACX93J_15900, partial [Flagellimonas marinaquae]
MWQCAHAQRNPDLLICVEVIDLTQPIRVPVFVGPYLHGFLDSWCDSGVRPAEDQDESMVDEEFFGRMPWNGDIRQSSPFRKAMQKIPTCALV